jgi:hypothetical protein
LQFASPSRNYDLLAFLSLTLVVWWTRKFGTASLTGLVVTALTLILPPGALYMLGFGAANILFDLLVGGAGYTNCFENALRGAGMSDILLCALSWCRRGMIGSFFMGFKTLPSILTFAGLQLSE